MTDLERGKALFDKQEFEQAIKVLNTFLSQEKNNADALYIRAICYRKTEKFNKSINDLTAILKRLPEEATLLCERGISHFNNKNIEMALKDMNKAAELEPNNPFRYSSRAYIKAKIDIEGAMADYEKAIELDPKDEISLNNLGLLQENAGKMKAAKKSFKKSNDIIGYHPKKRIETKNEETKKKDVEPPQNSFVKVVLSLFTSKETRREYANFLKSIFKNKNQ